MSFYSDPPPALRRPPLNPCDCRDPYYRRHLDPPKELREFKYQLPDRPRFLGNNSATPRHSSKLISFPGPDDDLIHPPRDTLLTPAWEAVVDSKPKFDVDRFFRDAIRRCNL